MNLSELISELRALELEDDPEVLLYRPVSGTPGYVRIGGVATAYYGDRFIVLNMGDEYDFGPIANCTRRHPAVLAGNDSDTLVERLR